MVEVIDDTAAFIAEARYWSGIVIFAYTICIRDAPVGILPQCLVRKYNT